MLVKCFQFNFLSQTSKMEFRDLLVILGSFHSVFNCLVTRRLLASQRQCSGCDSEMELTETARVNDGYMWRCTNSRC